MEWLSNPEIWAALLTLTIMELVLGIDNIVFISLLAGEPHNQQKKATILGLSLAFAPPMYQYGPAVSSNKKQTLIIRYTKVE